MDTNLEKLIVIGLADQLDTIDFSIGDSLHAPISGIMTGRAFPKWHQEKAVPILKDIVEESLERLKHLTPKDGAPLPQVAAMEELVKKVNEFKQKFDDFPSFEKTGCKCIHDYAVIADDIHSAVHRYIDSVKKDLDDGEYYAKFVDNELELYKLSVDSPISVNRMNFTKNKREPYSAKWWDENNKFVSTKLTEKENENEQA